MVVWRNFLFLLVFAAGNFLPVWGDENVVQEFSGNGTTTTALFKVKDKWEVRWNARQVISVAVMSSDGAIVAGAAGVLRGSLFVPLGGQYYFKVTDGTDVVAVGSAPAPKPDAPPDGNPPSAVEALAWHLQVVELGTSVASTQALTVFTPYFTMPDAAITPAPAPVVAPPPAEPPPPTMTDDQIHAIVTITGDNAQGFGVLVRTPDGTFILTHLHLIASNPNLKIFTDTGVAIPTLGLKGASDRDLALLSIKDDHYTYLPLSTDTSLDVAPGDEIIVPDTTSAPINGKHAKVANLSPLRLDFDMPAAPDTGIPIVTLSLVSPGVNRPAPNRIGSDGVPVIAKTGKALAVTMPEKRVDLSDDIAKAWRANPVPGAANIMPFYGLRVTGVPQWETYDLARFQAESQFLKQFHDDSRCLDSFLNGKNRRNNNGPPNREYFLNNAKLKSATESYKRLSTEADRNQRLEAARELGSDLVTVATTGVDALQGGGLYGYNQLRAQEELAYRKALRAQIEDLNNNLQRLDNLARTR